MLVFHFMLLRLKRKILKKGFLGTKREREAQIFFTGIARE